MREVRKSQFTPLLFTDLFLFTAPSSGPTSVRVTTVTASSISVQWGEVPCVDRNGEITGYTARALRSGVVERTANATGGASKEVTIFGLSSSTRYIVEVAAVNDAGTGPYTSSATLIRTMGKWFIIIRENVDISKVS